MSKRRKMKMKKNKDGKLVVEAPKQRNLYAVAAHFRTSAGSMPDRKKKRNKKCCRGNQLRKSDF